MSNIENLKKVRDIILDHPTRFDYCIWIEAQTDYGPADYLYDCNTPACVAGWAASLFYQEEAQKGRRHMLAACVHGQQYLKLTNNEADWLFCPWQIIDANGYRVSCADPDDHRSNLRAEAIRRLDWLIEGNPIRNYLNDPHSPIVHYAPSLEDDD